MSGENGNGTGRPLTLEQLKHARETALVQWLESGPGREIARLDTEHVSEKGADWLRRRGVDDGEWLQNTKLTLERDMWPDKTIRTRIKACGQLQAIGYQSELAIKLKGGRIYSYTANDILYRLNTVAEDWAALGGFVNLSDEQKKALHVTKQDVRRGLAGIEAAGDGLRTLRSGEPLRNLAPDERKRLHMGDILLFFFFRPIPPDPDLVGAKCLPIFASLSPKSPKPKLFRSLKLLGLDVSPDAVVSSAYLRAELAAAVRDYRKAARVGKESAKQRFSVAAQRAHIEKNYGETNKADTTPPPTSSAPPAPEQKADEEDNPRLPVPPPNTPTPALPAIRAPYDVFKAMYPPAHFDEGKARPVFQSKTALEQVHVLQQLHRYRECDRWRDRDGQWIPLASNWLKSYDADPPPAFRPADTKTDELRQELEDTANLARWLNTGGVK